MDDGRSRRDPEDEIGVETRGGVRVVALNRPDPFNAAKRLRRKASD